MKYFTISCAINDELFDKFIEFYNKHGEEKCTLVFNSVGGSVEVAETIIRMISQMADCTILIQAVYSSAFDICYLAKCKKVLGRSARGMVHQHKARVDIAANLKPYYSEDKCLFANFKYDKLNAERMVKKIMTAKELKKYRNEDEVWFDYPRMKKLFPEAELMK